jgi:anti-sigma regulatory factor (Ser/Thr protein kinase)
MCHEASCALECQPIAVRVGRQFIAERLSDWGAVPSDSAYEKLSDVLLAASELLSNAVKFCGDDEVVLAVRVHQDEICVAVTDPQPAPAVARRPGPNDEGGRGLALVEAVTDRWGQERKARGKTVWFAVGVPNSSALARGCTRNP